MALLVGAGLLSLTYATAAESSPSSGGNRAVWRGDGEEILYINRSMVCSLPVEENGETLRPGTPRPLFRIRLQNLTLDMIPMAVTRDGSRILVAQEVEEPDA